jgi:hypothetical protein
MTVDQVQRLPKPAITTVRNTLNARAKANIGVVMVGG